MTDGSLFQANTASQLSRVFDSAERVVDALINSIGKSIVLGLPIGIGKAVRIVDELYKRAESDQSISLTIFTGLTLESPTGGTGLEQRFMAPLVERLYTDWPTPLYASAIRNRSVPKNVQIREFYLRPGAYLNNAVVQQNYTSVNYSQVTAELLNLGVNVIAQLVAIRPESPGRYSLSSNPEITLDLLPQFEKQRLAGRSVAMIGQVNRNLPYMLGDADISQEKFDFILDNKRDDFPLFTLPNRHVSPADYATAMHVASLIPDGGTLQIGIGSLSDALAHCLKLRHRSPEIFRTVLDLLPGGSQSRRRAELPIEDQPFELGLFASTELLSDALFSLFDAGLIKRKADTDDHSVIHAGFFIGSTNLYNGLSALSENDRGQINMTRISEVNTLFGDEQRKRRQRSNARFVNETMMVTLLGSAISDGLYDGRVVSGVGGQFDFVSMAHSLEDAQSILMCRAVRNHAGRKQSNVRWNYAHTTVPRHHRDVYVSEYGIAATRGRTDEQVIRAMLGIADAAFHLQLINDAQASGKIPEKFELDIDTRNNTSNSLAHIFEREDIRHHFPAYPLGTELTSTEQELVSALEWLKVRTARPGKKLATIAAAFTSDIGGQHSQALSRMSLTQPKGVKQRIYRRLIGLALERTQ